MWWKKIAFNNYYLTAFIVSVFLIAIILILSGFLPPVVPLFYGRPVGETQLVTSYLLVIAPGVSLVVSGVNLLISMWVKDVFTKRILAITTLVVSLITVITVVKIILLVGFF